MRLDHLLSKEDEVGIVLLFSCQKTIKYFWCRCAYGKHPFSVRTRWLRRRRPMVLCWRRHGRVGGCQNYGGIAQLGERLPCKQEVTSSNLVISTQTERSGDKNMYLENYILKMIRHQTVKKQILLIRTHFFTIKMTGPSL